MRRFLVNSIVEDSRRAEARSDHLAKLEPLFQAVFEEQPTAEGVIAVVLSLTPQVQLDVRTGFLLRRTPSALTKQDLVRALRSAANALESQKDG